MPSDLDRFFAQHGPHVPKLRPLTPFQLIPSSACPHKQKIKRGSVMCCLICHQSGQDYRRHDMPGKIVLDPETGEPPRPEYSRVSRTTYSPAKPKQAKLTRRQKRAAMRAAVEAEQVESPC